MKRFVPLLVGAALAGSAITVACRNSPGEPKTPPNSPLPEIEKRDDDQNAKPPPSPIGKDGGS